MIPNICTLTTINSIHECEIFLISLKHFHPNISIYISCDTESLNYINLFIKKYNLNNIYLYNLLDKYKNKEKENWLEFMFEKCNIINIALEKERNILFCDIDMIFTNYIFNFNTNYDIGLSPAFNNLHKFGKYNAGFIFINNKNFTKWWRENRLESDYFEQETLNRVYKDFKIYEIEYEYNYQWSRLENGNENKLNEIKLDENGWITENNIIIKNFHLHINWNTNNNFLFNFKLCQKIFLLLSLSNNSVYIDLYNKLNNMYFDLWNYRGIFEMPIKFYIPKEKNMGMKLYLIEKWEREGLIEIKENNINENIYINEIGEIGFNVENKLDYYLNIDGNFENKLFYINLLKRDYYFDKIMEIDEIVKNKNNKLKIIKKGEIIDLNEIKKSKFIINLKDDYNEIEFFSFGCIPIFIKNNKFEKINLLKENIHYLFFNNEKEINENIWFDLMNNGLNFYKNFMMNKNSLKELIKIISLNY
jgi:hypothetical protein